MNILFLVDIVPYPPNTGIKIRTFNIIKQLHKNGNKIFLCAFNHKIFINDEKTKNQFKNELKKYCEQVHIFEIPSSKSYFHFYFELFVSVFDMKPYRIRRYRSSEFKKIIEKIVKEENISLVHMDKTEFYDYFPYFNNIPAIPTNHNVESLLFKRRIKGEVSLHKKFFALLQYFKTRRYERDALNSVGSYITVSKEDKNYFKNTVKIETSSVVIENGVDTEYYKPKGLEKEEYVLIIGAQSKAATANYDATIKFMKYTWPLITNSGWQGKLKIVGRNPDPSILSLGDKNKNVEVMGFVEDERPILERAKLLLVPLRIGGGSRLKILTAFAMKTAVVSTSIGAEGIEYTNNKNIILRDEPEDFAKATLEMLSNDVYRHNIENNARHLAESFYDWNIIGSKLNQLYTSLVKN